MVGCNRVVKIICMTLGIYLLTANIILWANDPSVNVLLNQNNPIHINEFFNFASFHGYNATNFKGFGWFFDKISTFPGLSSTHKMMMTYGNIVSNFHVTDNNIVDAILGILRLLTTPINLTVTLFIDILNNAIWFFSFIFTN